MIGKVTRGSNVGGLLRYLYGPGRANEHTNPHLVGSWLGDDAATLSSLEPVASRNRFGDLADRLSMPLGVLPAVPNKFVWQCSMRLAEGDRRLTDAEWAVVAREVVEQTGFAPAADPGGCRWVAVRHADDHIHIVVTLARDDGQPVTTFRDWPKVHAAARAVEARFGLTTVPSPDRTAAVAPTRAETEKAERRKDAVPTRAWLARQVRAASAGSASREDFERLLTEHPDVVVAWRYSQQNPGEVTGYRVGRRGDADARGVPAWFSGSRLAPDLSLPKLIARWNELRRGPQGDRSALGRAASALERAQGRLTPGVAVSAGEVAAGLAQVMEGPKGGPLTAAADDLARSVRQPRGVRPEVLIHDLRHVALDIAALGQARGDDAQVLEVLLRLAQLARLVAQLTDHPLKQQAASRAESGYRDHVARRTAPEAELVRRALGPAIADRLTAEPAWGALAARLREQRATGADVETSLRQALGRRETVTAKSLAAVLHHRLDQAPTRAPGPYHAPTPVNRPRGR